MLRVGIVGTGRISDLHAIEYLQSERARIVAVCDIDDESAQSAGRRVGRAARPCLLQPPRPACPARPRPGRDLAAPSPPPSRDPGHPSRRQARLRPEADGAHLGRSRRDDRGRGCRRKDLAGLRKLHLLPARRACQGPHRRRRDRRPAHHSHQEQRRLQPDRLARAARRLGLALQPGDLRRRPHALRRRPPQIRPRLALYGTGRAGARLGRRDGADARSRAGHARHRFLEISRQPLRLASKSSTHLSYRSTPATTPRTTASRSPGPKGCSGSTAGMAA